MLLMFVVLGVAAAGTNAGFSESCETAFGMFPFDMEQFTGDWYAVSLHHTKELVKNVECLKLNYTVIRTEKTFKLRMLAESGRNEKTQIELRAQELWWGSKMDSSVSHAVWRINKDPKWTETSRHTVVASDYTTYAITKVCYMVYSESVDDFKRQQLTLILSRTQEMDPQTLKVLQSVAMADTSGFQVVKNSDCWK